MTMGKCPKCKIQLCDPDLYFRAKGERRKNLKMKITCPSCNFTDELKEFIK
jgi:hypothetical protein